MILLLSGANDFAARQALDKLVAAMLQKHGAHAIERVDGEALDISRLPDLLQGASLFASDKLVIVRDAGKNKTVWEALGDWAERVPAEITMVILESSPDKRTRTYKQIQKHGKVHDFPELNEHELAKWAMATAKEEGGTLDAKTAAYVVRQAGTNQWQLSGELHKLLAANPTITSEAVDELVEPSPQTSAFDLLDAVLGGKNARAMELLARLKTNEDPYKLFGLLVSQIQALALVATAQGKTPDVIAKDAGIHPFVVRKLQPLGRTLNATQLRGVLASVALADTHMKSTGVDPWVLMEQCLGKIASRYT
jgi:DNA polymerase-3 subunit delta